MTRKQQELSLVVAILGTIIIIIAGIAWYKSGKIEPSSVAPEDLSYSDAKAFCENNGGRLPTSSELKKMGKTGWTSNFAPDEDRTLLPDKPRHVCIKGDRDMFCLDADPHPVYCVNVK